MNRTNRINTACNISHKGGKAAISPAILKLLAVTVMGILLLGSCGPVNRFTRVRKIPREYSLNYCGGEVVKAPRTDVNKNPWIVYSDREKNASYNTPGGRVKAKDVDYLAPFLVIGTKGDYLKLVKYTPDVLKNGKLDYKKAEYYGWMPKSQLLLNYQSVTDISGGRKNKSIVVISDTVLLADAGKYAAQDSVKLYRDLRQETPVGNVAPYSIVYRMKQDEKNGRTLIAKKTQVKPEEVKQDILGWVDNSMLTDIGQVLFMNINTLPDSVRVQIEFKDRSAGYVPLTADILDEHAFLSEQYQSVKYIPAASYSTKDTLVAFRAHLAMPVFDNSNNYIFNVNGGHISHKAFRDISKSLKNINIVFVFEGRTHTIAQFPQIVNALQNLQQLFVQPEDTYSYRFGCVMTIGDSGRQQLHPVSAPLTSDYAELIYFLTEKANNKDKLKPLTLNRTWSGINKAVDMLAKHKDESNLIVVIGESGYTHEEIAPALTGKLAENNCRIVGFQVYASDDNASNNFVLDLESMIDSYANTMKRTKGDILVSPEQIKQTSSYIEIGDAKNGYRLDFPENSITQGAILFPQKDNYLPLDILTTNVDTVLQQIRQDNASVVSYMARAFNTVGSSRTRFNPLFIQNFGLDSLQVPPKEFVAGFKNEPPAWDMVTAPIILSDSLNRQVGFRLMLSEDELNELKGFVESLSKKEVDYITLTQDPKQKETKPCNCDEDLFAEMAKPRTEITVDKNDTLPKYVLKYYTETSGIRKYMKNLYLNAIKYCKLCKPNGKILKSMTLAEAQRRITGCPTTTPLLHTIKIQDLTKSKIVSDRTLDELIQYFKSRRDDLNKAEKFESNGQPYYWVDRNLLP